MIEIAVRCGRDEDVNVVIICPTGSNVYSLKSQLPDFPGVDRIRVDTLHGLLKYKRPGKDEQVRWSPPSALRRIELILCEEASQYEDKDWKNLFVSIREQPHRPFTAIVADFAQLRPVLQGGKCERFCKKLPCVELTTVYRSTDPDHLLFLNRIRLQQPDRSQLKEYFGKRHWRKHSLAQAVKEGARIGDECKDIFT